MKNTILKSFFLVCILTIAIAGPYFSYINKKPYSSLDKIFLEKGFSNLQSIKTIQDELSYLDNIFLKIFLKLNNNPYQSGEYNIYNKSLVDIHNIFINGDIVTYELKIIPGMNIYDINSLIDKTSLINDCINLKCINNSFNFKEGTIFPNTYFYKKGMMASDLLKPISNDLEEFILEIFQKKPSNNPINNIEQALILASIIEKEAGTENEKDLIASVFLKRLAIGMKLQADPTIIYGLLPNFNGDIKKSDIRDANNKFNTYVINGLPPTPISIVNKKSIKAAIMNVPGEYLYFVANNNGDHYFSKTYNEHLEAVKLYQLK